MRKQVYIQKLNYRDERFCTILKNCHHMSREQVLSLISPNRLQAYQKQGLVRKLHYIYQRKQRTAYELTDKGSEWIRKNLPSKSWNIQWSTGAPGSTSATCGRN